MGAELAEAERLLEAARKHKRAARQHRDRAHELMGQLDRLITACAKRGITIEINRTAQTGGRSGHTAAGHRTEAQATEAGSN